MKSVVLARVERPRGRRGEVRAECLCAGPERLQGQSVTLTGPSGPRSITVEEAWLHDGHLVLKFAGIDSISAAEEIRGCELTQPFESRPELPEGEYYLSDLVDCELIAERDGHSLGKVEGWQETPAGVLLESGSLLIPFVRAICIRIDVAGRKIVVNLPEGLEDLNAP